MKKISVLVLSCVGVFFVSSVSWPLQRQEAKFFSCLAAPANFKINKSSEENHKLFDQIQKKTLISNLFFEVTQKESSELAYPLSVYLKNSTPDQDQSAFFGLIAYAAELSKESKRVKTLNLSELCSIQHKITSSSIPNQTPLITSLND